MDLPVGTGERDGETGGASKGGVAMQQGRTALMVVTGSRMDAGVWLVGLAEAPGGRGDEAGSAGREP